MRIVWFVCAPIPPTRGLAFGERTELREVAAATFASDGKPGLRYARARAAPLANSPPAAQAAAETKKPASDCASEQAALDRLRAEPSIDEAQAFWRGLQCERLRPQARMLMESLDIVVEEPSPHPVLGVASIPLSPKANDVRGRGARR
jgi:hypothetical protein